MFTLHPQLHADTYDLGNFPLCRLLLVRDACYPWFILVPQIDGVSEIFELSIQDQTQLLHESSLLAGMLKDRFKADKLNIAALGNVVPQLHIHHVVRYTDDPAWPAPIWGAVESRTYTEGGLASILDVLDRATISGLKIQPS